MKLPEELRPRGEDYKVFTPGIDLPSWFQDDLKSIDDKLFLVYHPYKVLWDDIINQYEGNLDDPRFTIHKEHGTLNFGFVLTDGQGYPTPDNTWHVWRLCIPHGWAHVIQVQDNHEEYLKLLVKRLHLQARFTDRYGFKAWGHHMDDEAEEQREKKQLDQEDLFGAFQKENDWLLKRAQENYMSGKIAPTNPQKQSIISYPGQVNRTATSRPLDDEEGGLYVPKN
jgi:hypothetical protein